MITSHRLGHDHEREERRGGEKAPHGDDGEHALVALACLAREPLHEDVNLGRGGDGESESSKLRHPMSGASSTPFTAFTHTHNVHPATFTRLSHLAIALRVHLPPPISPGFSKKERKNTSFTPQFNSHQPDTSVTLSSTRQDSKQQMLALRLRVMLGIACECASRISTCT